MKQDQQSHSSRMRRTHNANHKDAAYYGNQDAQGDTSTYEDETRTNFFLFLFLISRYLPLLTFISLFLFFSFFFILILYGETTFFFFKFCYFFYLVIVHVVQVDV